jgi:hypothetical protein
MGPAGTHCQRSLKRREAKCGIHEYFPALYVHAARKRKRQTWLYHQAYHTQAECGRPCT